MTSYTCPNVTLFLIPFRAKFFKELSILFSTSLPSLTLFFLRSLLNSLQYDFCYPRVNETTLVKANDCVTNTMVISLSSSIQFSVISQNFFHLNEISSGFLSTLLTTTSQSPFLTPPSLLNFSLIVGKPQDSVQDTFLPTLSL